MSDDLGKEMWRRVVEWTPEEWADRWIACYPATYPPELWSASGDCPRCGRMLITGHCCPDVQRVLESREDANE